MSTRMTLLPVLVLAAVAATARAEDPPTAPAAPAAQDSGPGVGERVRIKLRTGRAVEGIVMTKGTWERRTPGTGWTTVKREERGSGVRLWWTKDMDGFQFVPEREVVEMKALGTFSSSEAKEVAKRATDASERTTKERDKQEKAAAKDADAAEQAKLLVAEVEKAKKEGEVLALADAKRKMDESKAKRWAELLAKFPPGKWSSDTPKEIERRKTTLDLFPSEEEVEFLKVYTEWSEGLAALKAAQAAQAVAKSGGK